MLWYSDRHCYSESFLVEHYHETAMTFETLGNDSTVLWKPHVTAHNNTNEFVYVLATLELQICLQASVQQ